MNLAKAIRQFWDDLFAPKLNPHVEDLKLEVAFLRSELQQVRLDREKLQATLVDVTAGSILHRRNNPPPRPQPTPGTGPKRWAQIEAERYAEIAELKLAAAKEKSENSTSSV
jgi:1,6-anhydro-N-acetylmuramate kinase